MADFYIVTGGVGSSKNVIGAAFAKRYAIPLSFGESFYNDEQFALACAGTPFDTVESSAWAQRMAVSLAASGSCVVVCKHLDGAELPILKTCGTVHVIHTDPTTAEITARLAIEKKASHSMPPAGEHVFSRQASIAGEIIDWEQAREAARKAAEYEAMLEIWVREHEARIYAERGWI
jgi:gluconate kinase